MEKWRGTGTFTGVSVKSKTGLLLVKVNLTAGKKVVYYVNLYLSKLPMPPGINSSVPPGLCKCG
jgi:hypothetical protein